MVPTGFTQPAGAGYPFPIWVVLFLDKRSQMPERRIAGAFTSEDEAKKLRWDLLRLEGSGSYEYWVEPANLYKRNEDWTGDRNNMPYDHGQYD